MTAKTKIGLRRELTHKITIWRSVEGTPEAQSAAAAAIEMLEREPWLSNQVSPEVRTALEQDARSVAETHVMTLGELRQTISEIIKKCGGKYCLYTKHKKGGKRHKLGTHSSKASAERQERAIHAHGG